MCFGGQVSNNLLPEWQSGALMELVKELVSQLLAGPPPPHHSLRLNIDKVSIRHFYTTCFNGTNPITAGYSHTCRRGILGCKLE
jgi:hypothetical protein